MRQTKLHNEELHSLYCSLDVIRALRRSRWDETREACNIQGQITNAYRKLVGSLKGSDYLEI
jgi:hypothetical protein